MANTKEGSAVFVAWFVPVEDDDDGWSPGAGPGPCTCDIDIGTPTTAVGGLFCSVDTTIRGGA